jgi:hypothetical protein
MHLRLAKGGEGSVHLLCQRRPLSELCTLALHRRRCTFESKVANSQAFGLARTLTLRASGGSVTLSSYTQTQHSC